MSSTLSSNETRQPVGLSSTEALAARYRHLFVLPSRNLVLVYIGISSLALSLAAVGALRAPGAFALSFLLTVVVSFAIAKAAKLADSTSIATFRRSAAVILAGQLIWFLCAGAGRVYSFLQTSGHPVPNSVVFGAFLCAGFEFIVINGAFVESRLASAALSALHPLATTAAFLIAGAVLYGNLAAVLGMMIFAILVSFTLALSRRRTSRGNSAIELFQAFLKTWADDNASELETIIAAHSTKVQVSTKVLRFHQDEGDTFIILPGVHPGPFYPVGSYNLPTLFSQSFQGVGRILTLHRPGGHENNLATNASAKEYSEAVKNFAAGVPLGPEAAKVRGPLVTKVGKATASCIGIAKDMLLTISFAPYGSDDLESKAERELAGAASPEGYDIAVVDAHNSIDSKREVLDPHDRGWGLLMRAVGEAPGEALRFGSAHSSETGFSASGDLTNNGIALTLFEAGKVKWVLALADANNAVPGLREAASRALDSAGYKLLEFCTSDSHDLAARGLTVNRGYHALGEVTAPDFIANATVRLAALAESRLASCRYGSGTLVSEANVFGTSALNEFAEVTQRSSGLTKAYAVFAVASAAVFLALSLIA